MLFHSQTFPFAVEVNPKWSAVFPDNAVTRHHVAKPQKVHNCAEVY